MSYAQKTELIHVKGKNVFRTTHFRETTTTRFLDTAQLSFGERDRRCKHVKISQLQKSLCRKCFGMCGASENKTFWLLNPTNSVCNQYCEKRIHHITLQLLAVKWGGEKKNFFLNTKLLVCFSWNFIMYNVHKRNIEKNVLKVFIYNLQAFVHTTAWEEVAGEDGRRLAKFHAEHFCLENCRHVIYVKLKHFLQTSSQYSAAQFSLQHTHNRSNKNFLFVELSTAQARIRLN